MGQVFWSTVIVTNEFSIGLTLACCLCRPAIRGVLTGYLPALLISAVLYIVPIIMFFLSQVEGHASISHQERTATSKVFNLLAGNLFLAVVFSGSLITISESFSKNPREIPRRLAEAIPSQVHINCSCTLNPKPSTYSSSAGSFTLKRWLWLSVKINHAYFHLHLF